MLKAQVGLSRKISHNYNSSGYSVNLEAEISAALDQPDAVCEQIDRLFELAEQALQEEIARDWRVSSVAAQKSDSIAKSDAMNPSSEARGSASPPVNARASTSRNSEPATSRQTHCIQSLGKRQGWSIAELEVRIAEILGGARTIQGLNKKEAGKVIQELLSAASGNGGPELSPEGGAS